MVFTAGYNTLRYLRHIALSEFAELWIAARGLAGKLCGAVFCGEIVCKKALFALM